MRISALVTDILNIFIHSLKIYTYITYFDHIHSNCPSLTLSEYCPLCIFLLNHMYIIVLNTIQRKGIEAKYNVISLHGKLTVSLADDWIQEPSHLDHTNPILGTEIMGSYA